MGMDGKGLKPVTVQSMPFLLSHSDSLGNKRDNLSNNGWLDFKKIFLRRMFVCESIPCIAVILQYYNVILLF